MKFIFVSGGVLSGLGKGIVTSSIGLLLGRSGLKVTAIKVDPYLNCDAGTMNPYEHGEVFVLHDGGEVDLDLGNYERFLDVHLSSEHNITTGKIYRSVIEKERKGDYLGKTVQIVPHIVMEIRNTIKRVAKASGADVCMVELGGTVGDIESMPFLEAARQMHMELGGRDVLFVHTTLVPIMGVVGEQKTKPTQHSVKELRSIGIQPDVIVGRCAEPLTQSTKEKISLFCNVPSSAVFSAHDVPTINRVPLLLHEQGITDHVASRLELVKKGTDLRTWSEYARRVEESDTSVRIAIVGKYTGLKDSYISHYKAFEHSGAEAGVRVEVDWINAPEKGDDYQRNLSDMVLRLKECDGILVPGGFGIRGTEGKIEAIRFARENDVPFLGICLGLQLAVVEYARNIMGLKGANSTEFDADTPYPVVDLLPEQLRITQKGATMRLGAQKAIVKKGTMAYSLYGREEVWERHRHRYEINPDWVAKLEEKGFIFSAASEDRIKMEMGEVPSKRFHVGCQFHPEFLSHPEKPAPLFLGLVKAALEHKRGKGA